MKKLRTNEQEYKSVNLVFLIASSNTGSRSGKNTLAEIMISELVGLSDFFMPKLEEFSYPLKWICENILGLDDDHVRGLKKQDPTDISIKDIGENVSTRKIQQYLGTEVFRDKFGDDVWVKRAHREILKHNEYVKKMGYPYCSLVFIPDWRFENERDYLEEKGHTVIKINVDRPDNKIGITGHRSDNSLLKSSKEMDYYVLNDTTIEDLHKTASLIVEDVLNKYGIAISETCC